MNNFKGVFDKYQPFILNINKNKSSKINRLSQLINKEIINVETYKDIEVITDCVMKEGSKSDEVFLHWLYCFGEHINVNYNSKWALIKYKKSSVISDCYYPILMNKEEEIWFVGTDCERGYYKYNRLSNIKIHSYYELHVKQIFGKSKLKDIKNMVSECIML